MEVSGVRRSWETVRRMAERSRSFSISTAASSRSLALLFSWMASELEIKAVRNMTTKVTGYPAS